ncbi:MAG: transglycosylase SLT domain-containing protein, partial [Rubrivivax sp.]
MTISRALLGLCAAALVAGCATAPDPAPRIVAPPWPDAPVGDAQPARIVAAPAAPTAPAAPATAFAATGPAATAAPAPGSTGAPAPEAAPAATTSPVAPVAIAAARPEDRPQGLRAQFGAERMDSARADLWERVRGGFAVPDHEGELVRKWERWYAERPDYVERMMDRGARYLFHIVEEVNERGMPMELALLPFIESAFNPEALSRARASGMWQFMPGTGTHFDLKQNLFRDDRRSVIASTRAALDYLQMLHRMFGDWHLALAAYNWGQGNVQRAIARNERARQGTTYADLRMPDETRNYVPKLQAVKNIVLRPEAFGLKLPPLENHPFFLTVPIERDIDVALILSLSGLEAEAFRSLNPQLNKPVVLAAATPSLLLPYDEANRFVSGLATHVGPLSSWTAWVAPRTMKPQEAARLVRMSEAELLEINRIPPRMLVREGSALVVRRTNPQAADVSDRLADRGRLALAPEAPPRKAQPAPPGRRPAGRPPAA